MLIVDKDSEYSDHVCKNLKGKDVLLVTDTNTGDLRLVGVKIFFTTDAANDA